MDHVWRVAYEIPGPRTRGESKFMTISNPESAIPPPPPRLLPARWLDPRPAAEAVRAPLAEAVNIPLAELADRTQELPPPGCEVAVAAGPALAEATIAALDGLGRGGRAVGLPGPASGGDRYRLWQPTPVLEAWLADLPGGRSLDLGCGSGRDVVFLAVAGWEATGVDWLPDAIARGRRLAERYLPAGGGASWAVCDLEADGLAPLGRFDLITGFRFLHRPLLRNLRAWLRPGGCVVWETFTTEHRARHGKPRRDAFVLAPGELPTLCEGLEVVRYEEGWCGEVHTGRVLWREP